MHAAACKTELTAVGVVNAAERLALEWDTQLHRAATAAATATAAAAQNQPASSTVTPSATHTHSAADFDDSYELELYHIAQAFLDAARNVDSLHSHGVHSNTAYDTAIGLPTSTDSDAAAPNDMVVGATGPAAGGQPPSSGSVTASESVDYDSDSDSFERSSGEEYTGSDDDDTSSDDHSVEEEESEHSGNRHPNETPYDPDADADPDSEVDGDSDASLDDDDSDDAAAAEEDDTEANGASFPDATATASTTAGGVHSKQRPPRTSMSV